MNPPSRGAAASKIQRAYRRYRARKAAKKARLGKIINARGSLNPTATCNLVYELYDQLTVDFASGRGQEVFNIGGLYDPEVETGGGQARLFDQMMNFYKRYQVLSAFVTVEIFNSNFSVVGEPVLFGLYQTTSSTAAEFIDNTSLGFTRSLLTDKAFNPVMKSGMTNGTVQEGGKRIFLRQKITNPFLLNSGHETRDKEGTSTSNPAVGSYSALVIHADGQTANTTIKFRVRIHTRVKFSDPNDMEDA